MAALHRHLYIVLCGMLVLASQAEASPEEVTVTDYQLVSSTRVSRTDFEYIFTITVTNAGGPLSNVEGTVTSASSRTQVSDGSVTLGNIAAGDTQSTDSFSFVQNRRYVFNPNVLTWSFTADEPDPANTPPSIISTPVTSASVNSRYSYQVQANDPDPGDDLTFALQLAPAGLSINSDTGEISGTVQSSGPADVDVIVTDSSGASDRQIYLLRVNAGANDQPPTLNAIADQNLSVGRALALIVDATDPEGEPLRFGVGNVPAGLVINTTTGAVRWSPGAGQTGSFDATVTATDPGGQTASASFSIDVGERVSNRAPSLAAVADQQVAALESLQLRLSASDPDPGDILRFSLQGAPSGLQFDTSTGLISFRPGENDAGRIDLTASVTDSAGATASQSFAITVSGPAALPVAPIAVDDNYTVDRRQLLNVTTPGVLGNDVDADSPQLSSSLTQDVALGTLSAFYNDGSFTYSPPAIPNQTPQLQEVCRSALGPAGTVAAGDVDNDGVIELVFPAFSGPIADLSVLNGEDCTIELAPNTTNARVYGGLDILAHLALIDIDGDRDLEAIGVTSDALHLVALHHDGTPAWPRNGISEDLPPSPDRTSEPMGRGSGPVLADLDGDGAPELLISAKLRSVESFGSTQVRRVTVAAYDSRDGSLLWEFVSDENQFDDSPYSPIVADLDLDGSMEILIHNQVVSHQGVLEFILPITRGANPSFTRQLTLAVANFDNDPFPEIVAYHDTNRYLYEHDGTLIWQFAQSISVSRAPLTVADLDGDNQAEFAYLARRDALTHPGTGGHFGYVTAYEGDGSVLWSHAADPDLFTEEINSDRFSSGLTAFDANLDGADDLVGTLSLFPFLGGGRASELLIIDGRDGGILARAEARRPSRTKDFVTIADLDGDSEAEMVTTINAGVSNDLIVYEGVSSNPLPAARPLRNQWIYQPTHVDLNSNIIANPRPHWLVPGQNKFLSANTVAGVDPDTTDSFRYTASDDSSTSNEATVTIAVSTVNAPSILSTPATGASPGFDYRYGVLVSDGDIGDQFTYTLVDGPIGMTVDDFGIIQYNPVQGDIGAQRVQIVVTDNQGNSATQSYNIDVAPPATVPNLLGSNESQALAAISGAGLSVGNVANAFSPSVPAGRVVSQSTDAGGELPPASTLSFVLSLGPAPVAVPELKGLSTVAAETRLTEFSLQIGTVTRSNSDTQVRGLVTSQALAAGSQQGPGTAVDVVVSSGPALAVELAQPIIESGTTAELRVQVFDTNGQLLNPQPAASVELTALPGATGAAPQVSQNSVITSADTRGGFSVAVSVPGFGSKKADFAVRGQAATDTYYAPIVQFGAVLGQTERVYGDLLSALADGDTATVMTAARQLVSLRDSIDLDALEERTPFVAEMGFIPLPDELRAAGFPIAAQLDAGVAALFDTAETALEQQIEFLARVNPGQGGDDDLRARGLNAQLAVALQALLAANLDTGSLVLARPDLHTLLSVLAPQQVAAHMDASIEVLRDSGLLAENRQQLLWPENFYSQRQRAAFTLTGVLTASVNAVGLVKDFYLPSITRLISSSLVLATADVLSTQASPQDLVAIITAASQSFHRFNVFNSAIEGIGFDGNRSNYEATIIGPDVFQEALDGFAKIRDAESPKEALEKMKEVLAAAEAGKQTEIVNDVVRGCLFDQGNNCSQLVLGDGFEVVHSGGQFPAPVLITIRDRSRGGGYYFGVYNFFPN